MDGLLICSGPSMMADLKAVGVPADIPVAAVNSAIMKLSPLSRKVDLFSLDYPDYLCDTIKNHASKNKIVCHGGLPEKERVPGIYYHAHGWTCDQEMTVHDLPMLANFGVTMFTAIHWLACQGCRDIAGCGVDLALYPDGSYYGSGRPARQEEINTLSNLWERIRDLWACKMSPFLRKNQIAFRSKALSC